MYLNNVFCLTPLFEIFIKFGHILNKLLTFALFRMLFINYKGYGDVFQTNILYVKGLIFLQKA